jgi:hypothetical protein
LRDVPVAASFKLTRKAAAFFRGAGYEAATTTSIVWRIFVLTLIVAAGSCSNGEKSQPSGNVDSGASQHTPSTIDSSTDDDSHDIGGVEAETAGSGPPRQNGLLRLKVTGSGFDPAAPAPPPGQRYYTVTLSGIGRSRSDIGIDLQRFVFAQDERGCMSQPEADAPWLKNPLGATATFTAERPTEGQIAFAVPDDSTRLRVLIAPAEIESLAVPAGEDFTPSWPEPVSTIEDGTTLRVLVLPRREPTVDMSPPAAGRVRVVLDFVIENLKSIQGIEFTTSQQLRLMDPQGKLVQLDASTNALGCRLEDGGVIPPNQSRRFMAAYELPAGAPLRLQYRGFEVDETSVDLP